MITQEVITTVLSLTLRVLMKLGRVGYRMVIGYNTTRAQCMVCVDFIRVIHQILVPLESRVKAPMLTVAEMHHACVTISETLMTMDT